MANLKEIRTRIQSVTSTRQITSAMKMVSAAKLRKAQDAVLQLRPYANKLQEILHHLTKEVEGAHEHALNREREVERVLLIVITSNRGLCGAFNTNVVKQTIQLIEGDLNVLYKKKQVDILAFGKKGADILKSKGYPVDAVNTEIFDTLTYKHVRPIAAYLISDFLEGKYDHIKLIYNRFKNAALQELMVKQFLPIPEEYEREEQSSEIEDQLTREITHLNYIIEPSEKQVIDQLIPKSLRIQFFEALLDSNASEFGARMTAMHKATDNATEMIKELQLEYNKARQAAITTEILEIVGGAEALKG